MKRLLFNITLSLLAFSFFNENALHAQEDDRPGNTSFTLAISPLSVGGNTVPPVGFIADFGVSKWGAIGVYMGGYYRNFFYDEAGGVIGMRVTAQVFSIINAFLDSPIKVKGLKPYVGFAAGNHVYYLERYDNIYRRFSASPVVGVRYYPANGIGFLAEVGETFQGTNHINVGIVFGGR